VIEMALAWGFIRRRFVPILTGMRSRLLRSERTWIAVMAAGAPLIAGVAFPLIGQAQTAAPKIYVDGVYAGEGHRVGDTTYVPLRVVSEAIGAQVEFDRKTRQIKITTGAQARRPSHSPSPLAPPTGRFVPGIPLAMTRGTWAPVGDSYGLVQFKDAAVARNEFSAEIRVHRGLVKLASQPVRLDLMVTLYKEDGSLLVRDTVHVYNVSADGGVYTLSAPSLLRGKDTPHSCAIAFVGTWDPNG
jgi:hypothetical protein